MSIKINIKRYDKRIEKILLYILNNSLEFLQSSCRVNVVYRGGSSSFGLYKAGSVY